MLLYASESDELKYITLGFEAQITKAETLDGDEQAVSFHQQQKDLPHAAAGKAGRDMAP